MEKGGIMKRFLVVLVVLIGLFSGCQRATDEEVIQDVIGTELADYFSDVDNYEKPTGDTIADTGTKGHLYVFWFREVKNITKNVDVTIEGDSAFVVIHRDHSGILHRYPFDTLPPPDTLIDIPKNFSDNGLRYAIFKKVGDLNINRGWVLTDISFKKIVSTNEPPFKIDSVKIMTFDSSMTWLITNPLTLIPKDSIMRLPRGKKLIITVYTSPSTENVVVFIHTMGEQRLHRYRIRKAADGVFQGLCFSAPMVGIHRWGIDVLTYGTIFEDDSTTYPYEAEAWIIPYVSTAE